MDWATIGSFLAGLVAGYTLKFAIDIRVRKQSHSLDASARDGGVSQTGNISGGPIVGGDYAGGDLHKGDR